MADGRWQMADGRWQMADGRWQMADEVKCSEVFVN
jgi:2-amino-4-hydroxy-6-hydroxymethyldihydropteridine diphosphokinase